MAQPNYAEPPLGSADAPQMTPTAAGRARHEQQRFQEMRARLLGQDQLS